MLAVNLNKITQALLQFSEGETTLSEVEFLIGDTGHFLSQSAMESRLIAPDGKRNDDVKPFEAVVAVLLLIAMRQNFTSYQIKK